MSGSPEGCDRQVGRRLLVRRWRVRVGAPVALGQAVAECCADDEQVVRVRAHVAGRVGRLLVERGRHFREGDIILEIEKCTHPTVMKDMCADCGTDLRADEDSRINIASVPMIHSVPELKVSEELAQELGKKDSDRLLRDRKLVLLVDLDQTLIHTTNDHIPPNLKDVYHFQLRSWCPGGGGRWYHTRLRPGTKKFLKAISAAYELHICTFGARAYAHKVAELLDPHGELFSHRILSRDECFDIHTKTPNLKALFPCGDNLVCIIDDREDVWNRASNLIQVKPYHFFEHTGDINAPPGLGKTERDIEGQGVHLEDLKNKKEDTSKKSEETTEKSEETSEKSEETSEKSEETCEKSEETSKKSEELPTLDMDTIESPNPKQIENSTLDPCKETNNGVKIVQESEAKEEINKSADVNSVEKAIVKDIEKIVSQVQENFTNTNISKESVESDNSSKDVKTKENLPNIKYDSITSPILNENIVSHNVQTKWKITEDGLFDVEDGDDYLFFLEEILQRIHKSFYDKYDTMEAGSVPDLKLVIPEVKSQVLAGMSLVFSGLVPTHQKLEHSRAYMVAQSLGAEVTQDFTERTTHLVAVRPGTAKVHACRRASGNAKKPPHTVTPAWLWCCAERWEHVEEVLFPLRGGVGRHPRRPPPHCGSPPRVQHLPNVNPRRRTPSGRFMDTINPLLSFSSDDIADMDKEVEDIINESDESDSDDKVTSQNGNAGEVKLSEEFPETFESTVLEDDLKNISSESESIESLSGEYPHGWNPDKSRKRRRSNSPIAIEDCDDPKSSPKHMKESLSLLRDTEEETQNESTCEEYPSEKFRRGGDLPSDGPDHNDSDTNGSADAPDDIDDGEWNMMGAALEREFLGLDK